MTQHIELRERVRERYAQAARDVVRASGSGECCSPLQAFTRDAHGRTVWGRGLYDEAEADGASAALSASLGCGMPTAVADLSPGQIVLDLGSGAGGDVLISARRVAPGGRAIGLDMTEEMLALAQRNAAEAGVDNVEFILGYLEEIPLPDSCVDVVISNCVINLAADKEVVLAEAARVLRPGGRFAVSDVVLEGELDEATKTELAAHTGCIAGALTEAGYRTGLQRAGFVDVEVRRTHEVHPKVSAAIIRAVRS